MYRRLDEFQKSLMPKMGPDRVLWRKPRLEVKTVSGSGTLIKTGTGGNNAF